MKNYPRARIRALEARFGATVLSQYLGEAPRYVKQLADGRAKPTARDRAALEKLAGHAARERKLLRLDAVNLATRAGVTLATAKKWKASGTLGTSKKSRVFLLNAHVTPTEPVAVPARVKWEKEHYEGRTTRGNSFRIALPEAGMLFTTETVPLVASWLQSLDIPNRWRGRGSSYLITGIANCVLKSNEVGPGSGGVVVKLRSHLKVMVKDFVISSCKQSTKAAAISEWLAEAHNAADYETTLLKLEVKVYRDK